MKRVFSNFFFFSLILIVASCTFKSVAVNNLESIVSYRLGGQLHLYYGQKAQLKEKLQSWILASEQKKKIETFSVLLKNFDWQKSDLREFYMTVNQIYLEIATSFNQLLAESLSLLDEKQQKKFFASMEEENQKVQKEKKTSEGIRRMLEFCFEEITEIQEELLAKTYGPEKSPTQTRLERRLTSQQALREIYQLNLSETERIPLIKSALDDSVKRPPDLAQIDKNLSFFKELTQTLTADQLKTFETKRLEILEIVDLLQNRTE